MGIVLFVLFVLFVVAVAMEDSSGCSAPCQTAAKPLMNIRE